MTAQIAATIKVAPSKLAIDPLNARKTFNAAKLAELAESIAHEGVLQNIVVRPAEKKGHYFITAGSRRFRAVSLLIEQGRLPKNFEFDCMVKQIDEAQAIALSIAENIMRDDMLGSVSRLSCWIRTAVMVVGDIRGAYRGRHTDVRVKRSRSVARTTLEAAATPQAF